MKTQSTIILMTIQFYTVCSSKSLRRRSKGFPHRDIYNEIWILPDGWTAYYMYYIQNDIRTILEQHMYGALEEHLPNHIIFWRERKN